MDRLVVPLTALFLPALLASIARLPNVHIARFHLISAFGLVLLIAQLFAWICRTHRPLWAVLFIGAIGVGSALDLEPLLRNGRGN